jgi:hypothetical protein
MSTMFVRRILVVTTACALAWVFSTTGRDGHAEAPGAAPAPAATLLPPPATAAVPQPNWQASLDGRITRH